MQHQINKAVQQMQAHAKNEKLHCFLNDYYWNYLLVLCNKAIGRDIDTMGLSLVLFQTVLFVLNHNNILCKATCIHRSALQ